MRHRKGLIIWLSVLSGLQNFTAAAAFAQAVGPQVSALALAATGALTTATAVFVAASKGETPVVEGVNTPRM